MHLISFLYPPHCVLCFSRSSVQANLQNSLLAPAALARSKQEALDALPADYYLPDVDPLAGELAMLPRMFTEADLEAVVEERSGVLEVLAAIMLITYCISGSSESAALLWPPEFDCSHKGVESPPHDLHTKFDDILCHLYACRR